MTMNRAVLHRVRSLSTVGPGVVDSTYRGRGGGGVFMAMSDQAGAVFEVDAQEAELTEDQVIGALKSGQLKTTDLVFEGGRWTTFAESIVFEEVARGPATGEAFVRNAKYVLMGLGATIAMFAYVLLRVLARH
jgi:hypothetical protein